MKPPIYDYLATAMGRLLVVHSEVGLSFVSLVGSKGGPKVHESWVHSPLNRTAVHAPLVAYLEGDASGFDFRRDTSGTPFQERVWDALLEIPYGATATYGEIAAKVGKPGAARAVGLAIGANPLMILVPCHRVIGKKGSLTGFAGGLEAKRWLLDREAGPRTRTKATHAAAVA